MTKGPEELALMAESGRLLASVFGLIDRTALCGLSTLAVDTMVERFIVDELIRRTRARQALGDSATSSASAALVIRPSRCNTASILRSMRSMLSISSPTAFTAVFSADFRYPLGRFQCKTGA